MQKIPTMFERDETKNGHPVTQTIKPECQWVLDGEGRATVKIDGTNVKVENGVLYKRQKPKERDYDEASYVPCDRANTSDKWAFEAFDREPHEDAIYELMGPKVQGNPSGFERHCLIRVVPPSPALGADVPDRSFDGLHKLLLAQPIEGLVFHHPDGRFAKIKRRDFGIPWPLKS